MNSANVHHPISKKHQHLKLREVDSSLYCQS